MKDIETILIELRRPFKSIEVDWKVQATSKNNDSALVVAYIDARDVAERLNKVCPAQWSDSYTPIIVGNDLVGVQCQIKIRTEDTVLTRQDAGIGDLNDDVVSAGIKTHYSDAFKRAGVKFGIASSLYDLPGPIWQRDGLYISNGKIRGLNQETKDQLKERYSKWVKSDFVKEKFGEVY